MTKKQNTQKKNHPPFTETGLPFGKPQSAKRREEKYPALFTNESCYFCGSQQNLQVHHIMQGNANRKVSEQYGLITFLCAKCHQIVTDNKNGKYVLELKQEARKRFFDAYGANEQMFYDLFGRIGFKGEE